MSSFNELYEELLTEMPWMDFKAGNKEVHFDLELENYKDNWEGFLLLFKKILNGEELVDKRGGKIQLTSDEEKQAFIEELRNDSTFNMFLFNFFIEEKQAFIEELRNNSTFNMFLFNIFIKEAESNK